jgi:2-haloacid dehalogenase
MSARIGRRAVLAGIAAAVATPVRRAMGAELFYTSDVEQAFRPAGATSRWPGAARRVSGGERVIESQAPGPAIRAFVFDAYGTLFDVHSVVALSNEIFPGRGEALSQLWRNRQLEYSWLLTLMDRYEDFWAVTQKALVFACRSLGLDCDERTRQRLLDAYLRLAAFPDVAPALASLKGTPLAILSNGSPRMLAAAVESAGLKETFAHVISVDELRLFKPSARVYRLAPEKLGMPVEAIGFVSSNSFDVQGAKSAGLRTFWINRTKAPAEELGFAADAMLGSLTELRGLIAR